MAILKKLKKGNVARWTIRGATSGDYFSVPRGFRLLNALTVETTATLNGTGTLSLGKVVGVNDVYTIPVTSAYTGTGTCTWGGGVVNAGTVITTAQATAIAALAGGVTGVAQLTASAAAIALNQPTLVGVFGNQALFSVTSVGINIILTATTPGVVTPAPTLSSTGAATFGTVVHTTTGSVDTTYLAPTAIPSITSNSVSLIPLTSPITTSTASTYLAVPSTNGHSMTTTYTTTSSSAGTFNLCGQSVSIPYTGGSALTANQIGIVMGGRSFYHATSGWVGSGNITINGVTVATGGSQTAMNVALNNAVVPGWIIIAPVGTGTTFYMYATRSGPQPLPVIVASSSYATFTTIYSQTGFNVPGYVNDSVTPITNTVTFTGTISSAGVYAINGIPIKIPLVATTALTVAQTAKIASGCAAYYFELATAPNAKTNYLNNAIFTTGATADLTAAALATLANIPGWAITNPATAFVLMVADTPGYRDIPVFSAGSDVVCTLSASPVFVQGFTLKGYTSSYTSTTSVWVGPSPVFTTLQAPGTQTYAVVCSLAGSTGSNYIYSDTTNPGAQAPSLIQGTTAVGGTTYANVSIPADVPYYLNFSNSALHGNINVTAEMEKFS
jgi:hypothetical protein